MSWTLGVSLVARSAIAELPPIGLQAPPDCGTREELQLAVRTLVRDEIEVPASLRFEATIVRGPDRSWLLTLKGGSEGRGWSRQLAGASCLELRDAAAVLIAMSIDPSMASGESKPSPEVAEPTKANAQASPTVSEVAAQAAPAPAPSSPTSVVETASDQVAVPAPAPPRVRAAERPPGKESTSRDSTPSRKVGTLDDGTRPAPVLEWSLTGRGGVAAGILPEPTLALLLGISPAWGRLRISGDAGWFLPQDRDAAWTTDRGGRFQSWFVLLMAGYAVQARPFELASSGGIQCGYLLGQGTGGDLRSSEGAPYAAAAVRLEIAMQLSGPMALVAATDGWHVLGAPRFKLRASDPDVLFDPNPLGALLTLGARVRLR